MNTKEHLNNTKSLSEYNVKMFTGRDEMKKYINTALQFDKERQSVILQSIGDAVIATDLDANIILMNAVAERLTGWKSKEALNKPINHVFHIVNKETRELSINPVEAVLKTGKTVMLEPNTVLISQDDNIEYFISDSCAPILDVNGNIMGVVLVFRDVTKQKEEEALKEKITADLLQRNKDHEHFDNIISHDLRGPVSNILSLTSLVNDKDLEAGEKEFMMKALTTSAERLDEVIVDLNAILTMGKHFDEKKEAVHFSKMVSNIQESQQNIIGREQIHFNINFQQVDEMLTIKSYMHSIFSNLISNSIKYRNPNVPLEITVKSELIDENIVLTFQDNGLGIDLGKNRDDVFGLYKRFHIDKAEGKGLGLYMVKEQVEKLGGTIGVKSIVNEGTEFTIVLSA